MINDHKYTQSLLHCGFNKSFYFASTILILSFFTVGCSSLSSSPSTNVSLMRQDGGIPYSLPKGVIPIRVFADSKGVGITIEESRVATDNKTGILIAHVKPSPFNNEDYKLAVDDATGLLNTISTESEAKLPEIVSELGKAAGKLALQNSRSAFLEQTVTLLEDQFDPFSQDDIERINKAINSSFSRGMEAFTVASGTFVTPSTQQLYLSVHNVDGSPINVSKSIDLEKCAIGFCARATVTKIVRISLNGISIGSKQVNIPSQEILSIAMPKTVLANQKVTVQLVDGIIKKYDIARDSEILGIAKLPGAALGGIIAGATEQIDGLTSVTTKKKELVDSKIALTESKSKLTSLELQNAPSRNQGYIATTLTIYPYSDSLSNAIRSSIDKEKSKQSNPGPQQGHQGGDLVSPLN